MKKIYFTAILLGSLAGAQTFSTTDSLKGSDTAFRNFWDVKKYDLTVEADFKTKSVKGTNTIYFEITKEVQKPVFQIDLQHPMNFKIRNLPAGFSARRDGDFIFISTNRTYKPGERAKFEIEYSGNPVVAKNAPWDGGWVFKQDENGNPWMSVAQEGIGTSVWLPVKDLWSDEPEEGVIMNIITPKKLQGVGNGRLIKKSAKNGKNIFTWRVTNPINAYSIVPNIGDYVNFKDVYKSKNGQLDLDYWVLRNNLGKAKKQFEQVKPMLSAMEHWFGPYPFYQDSYKLVETPYLGMEHQSNVAYGNGYQNGYLGRDLSGTGVGLLWDFIIVHESGHEWFANSITAKDRADMWIHEAFTTYSEVLFTEDFLNKKDAEKYVQGIRLNIENDIPIIGVYGVRNSGSGDMYFKGANMIHTIRMIMNDDTKFRVMLNEMNRKFYHQTVATQQIESFISSFSGIDFSSVFDQYLRTVKVPVLEYSQEGNRLKFRYTNTVNALKLPVRLLTGELLNPTSQWQEIKLKQSAPAAFDANYYIEYRENRNP